MVLYGPPLNNFESQLDTPHQIVVPVTLSPENDYKVAVTESYQGKATEGGTQTFSFSPESDILTLWPSTLLTEVQNRTYTSGALPGQTGNFLCSQRKLAHSAYPRRTTQLPNSEGSWDSFGFALSTGTALQFTGAIVAYPMSAFSAGCQPICGNAFM